MQKLIVTFNEVYPDKIFINDEPIIYNKKIKSGTRIGNELTSSEEEFNILPDLNNYLLIDKYFLMNKNDFIEFYCDKKIDTPSEQIFIKIPLFCKLSIVFNYISYRYNILSIIYKKTFFSFSDFVIIFYVDLINKHIQKYYYIGILPELDNSLEEENYFIYCDQVIYKELFHAKLYPVATKDVNEFYIYECTFYYDDSLPNSRSHSLTLSKNSDVDSKFINVKEECFDSVSEASSQDNYKIPEQINKRKQFIKKKFSCDKFNHVTPI